jgi:hypothetical protein
MVKTKGRLCEAKRGGQFIANSIQTTIKLPVTRFFGYMKNNRIKHSCYMPIWQNIRHMAYMWKLPARLKKQSRLVQTVDNFGIFSED